VVGQTRSDVDYVTTSALGQHLADGGLGYMEEPGQVHGCNREVVIQRVVGECLADENPRVVDQTIDAVKNDRPPVPRLAERSRPVRYHPSP
jgi:hypothetical protein